MEKREKTLISWTGLFALAALFAALMFFTGSARAQEESVYRALLIGNGNYQKLTALSAPRADVLSMEKALRLSTARRFSRIEKKYDLTGRQIVNAFESLKDWDIGENDVTLVYYSGHGGNNGAVGSDEYEYNSYIIGVDYTAGNEPASTYTFSRMEQALSEIPGTVVVVIDSCYSGGAIGKSADAPAQSEARLAEAMFNQSVMKAFGVDRNARAMTGGKFHVVCASRYTQLSYEISVGGQPHSVMTLALCEALGYDAVSGQSTGKLDADQSQFGNGDGLISTLEAFRYTEDAADKIIKNYAMTIYPEVQYSVNGTLILGDREQPPKPASAPVLSRTSAVIGVNRSIFIEADRAVTWTSSKPSVATVDEYGLVTGKKSGTALITAHYTDAEGALFTTTCKVGVVAASRAVSALRFSSNGVIRQYGTSFTLKPTFTPTSPSNKTLIWTSSDESVATVSSKGVVKAVGEGYALITAEAMSGVTAQCGVTVIPARATKIAVTKTAVTVPGGNVTLAVKVEPSYAANRDVVWRSADESVATVDQNGCVTGVKLGKVKVYAFLADGSLSAACTVTVAKNEFIRSKPLTTSGKLRTSARKIYYDNYTGELVIQVYCANRAKSAKTLPAGSELMFKAAGEDGFSPLCMLTEDVRVGAGKTVTLTFRLSLDDARWRHLRGVNYRDSDAIIE